MVAMTAMPSRASLIQCVGAERDQRGKHVSTSTTTAHDLYRMVCALSGACEKDCNVLRDSQLVDFLEAQAKAILRARKAKGKLDTSSLSSSSSSSSSSRRRKLSTDSTKSDGHNNRTQVSPDTRYSMPRFFSAAMDKSTTTHGKTYKQAPTTTAPSSLVPGAKISKIERRPSVYQQQQESVRRLSLSGLSPLKSSILQVETNKPTVYKPEMVSPNVHTTPLPMDKEVDLRTDLAASMVSTDSSSSMPQYYLSDSDENPLTPVPRYSAHEYPEEDVSDKVHERVRLPHVVDRAPLEIAELSTNESTKKEATTMTHVDALSLLEKDTDDMEEDVVTKEQSSSMDMDIDFSLLDTLQSQVDLLLSENGRILAENDRLNELNHMAKCDAEQHESQRKRVAELLEDQNDRLRAIERTLLESEQRANDQESCRREAEVAFQAELDAKTEAVTTLQAELQSKDAEIARLTQRVEDISTLFATKMREAEKQRQSLTRASSMDRRSSMSPVKAKSEEMSTALVCFSASVNGVRSSTSSTTTDEDNLISSLRESNLFKEMEMKKMRASLMEKDREICHLYMHLSTKKKLIEEITKKFAEQLGGKSNPADATTGTTINTPTTDGVRFDMDMFLFKNVVDKQRKMDELSAALGVMDREVETLEARIAEKERENHQLRENHEALSRSLQTVNAQVCRIQMENERLDASLKEKQSRIKSLISSLEEKERHILELDEQVELRQTQLEAALGEAGSARRSITPTAVKTPRMSVASTRRGSRTSALSFSSVRDDESVKLRRSSVTVPDIRSVVSTKLDAVASAEVESVGRSSAVWSVASDMRTSGEWRMVDRKVSMDSRVSESEFVHRASLASSYNYEESVFDCRTSRLDSYDDETFSNRASYCSSLATPENGDFLKKFLASKD